MTKRRRKRNNNFSKAAEAKRNLERETQYEVKKKIQSDRRSADKYERLFDRYTKLALTRSLKDGVTKKRKQKAKVIVFNHSGVGNQGHGHDDEVKKKNQSDRMTADKYERLFDRYTELALTRSLKDRVMKKRKQKAKVIVLNNSGVRNQGQGHDDVGLEIQGLVRVHQNNNNTMDNSKLNKVTENKTRSLKDEVRMKRKAKVIVLDNSGIGNQGQGHDNVGLEIQGQVGVHQPNNNTMDNLKLNKVTEVRTRSLKDEVTKKQKAKVIVLNNSGIGNQGQGHDNVGLETQGHAGVLQNNINTMDNSKLNKVTEVNGRKLKKKQKLKAIIDKKFDPDLLAYRVPSCGHGHPRPLYLCPFCDRDIGSAAKFLLHVWYEPHGLKDFRGHPEVIGGWTEELLRPERHRRLPVFGCRRWRWCGKSLLDAEFRYKSEKVPEKYRRYFL